MQGCESKHLHVYLPLKFDTVAAAALSPAHESCLASGQQIIAPLKVRSAICGDIHSSVCLPSNLNTAHLYYYKFNIHILSFEMEI